MARPGKSILAGEEGAVEVLVQFNHDQLTLAGIAMLRTRFKDPGPCARVRRKEEMDLRRIKWKKSS